MEATFAAASQLAEQQYELEETHADLEVSATLNDVAQERLGKITPVMVGAVQNLVKLHHENEAVLDHNIEAGRRAVDLCSHAMQSNCTAVMRVDLGSEARILRTSAPVRKESAF